MMKKPKSPIRLSFGILGALITSALVIVACSRSDQNAEQMGTKMSNAMASDSTYTEVENMPQYPGGMDSLISYLASNIVYPKEAKENGTSGKVMVGFVIEKDGDVKEVNVIKGIGDGCDEEAARVIDEMPDWNPGSKDGKPVRVSYVIPISFSLDQSDKTEETYTVVEQMPEYPGGFKAMSKFLSANIKYPEAAKKDSISGRVFVSFIVEKDGHVADVSILRGIGGGCDEEAMRVVAMMPKWNPGMEKGKAVNVKYNLPIKFALN